MISAVSIARPLLEEYALEKGTCANASLAFLASCIHYFEFSVSSGLFWYNLFPVNKQQKRAL